jgi:hypothetical protein
MKTYGDVKVDFHIILISALDGGEWSVSRPGRFTTWEKAQVPTAQKAGWAPEPVWTLWRNEKSLAPAGNRTVP